MHFRGPSALVGLKESDTGFLMQHYLCYRLFDQSVKKFTRTKFRKHKMAMSASDVVVFSLFTGHKFRKFGKIVAEPAI